MPRRLALFAASIVFFACSVVGRAAEPVDFNRDVRPILSNNCIQCHGPDEEGRATELRLDTEESAKADLGGYAAISPGKPDDSELLRRIASDDEDERMPPVDSGKELKPEEIELLKRWVAEGAEWSLAWSYVPPERRAAPQVKDAAWPLNWVDEFVLARLESEGFAPAVEADKTTLIRRLSVDLTGLPPTPSEVAEFLADDRDDAYERLVDRLLESPHFGERMAMYWLDLVRYADTVGYHGDQDHSISPYRDYVIEAFNENIPFDQFTREQLAGDLLEDPTLRQRIATGYNRVLQTSHEGGVQPKEYLAIYAADRVRNVSAVWMGATMGCAQCHNHKYDPYTMRDFYSMQAFFADIDEASHFKDGNNRLPTLRRPEISVPTPEQQEQIAALEAELAALNAEATCIVEEEQPSDDEAKDESDVSEKSEEADKSEKKEGDDAKDGDADEDDAESKSVADQLKEKIADCEKRLQKVRDAAPRCMITVSIEPRTIRLLPRGNWLDDSGPIMSPAVPEFLGALEVGERRPTRLDLANWLVDAEQGAGGLTARVAANRFWYLMFGGGLARVLDDFGGQGEPPVHPELLDALAVEFVECGWDMKHMLKLLAMSRAYRQSSLDTPELRERDPLNRLFARQSRFRFPAETVRDTALLVSGLLVDEQGGQSVKPYQPAGYYRHLEFPNRKYQHHKDSRQWRRGVYVHWQRQFLHPMLKAFDAPSREECTAERPRSNTALAALVMLNDPTMVEASRAFAARTLEQAGSDDGDRLSFVFQQALSREPDDEERRLLSSLLEQSRSYYGEHADEAKKLLGVGMAPVDGDVDAGELAAWTTIARTILNMNETLTRN